MTLTKFARRANLVNVTELPPDPDHLVNVTEIPSPRFQLEIDVLILDDNGAAERRIPHPLDFQSPGLSR